MSETLQAMEAEWRSKLAAMREAISKLDLSNDETGGALYGQELGLSDDGFLYGSGSDDIWDLISDDASQSSEHETQQLNGAAASFSPIARKFDRDWLAGRCADVASTSSGFEADALTDQIFAVIASDSSGTMATLSLQSASR